ncbi:hypothetical protein A0H81_06080 [Grifola frondosa]|uniref:Uncharacterized protein n=1 Tax=Grifola frondosa TaxID=5627 RepID=A0A1C7MAI5_GRIFR|nr:hypothetical protein A0H81_06080 [Grifola frondosa]
MQTQSNAEFFIKLSGENRDRFAERMLKIGQETIPVLFASFDDKEAFEASARRFLECVEVLRLHGDNKYLEWTEYNVGQVQALARNIADRGWLVWGRELVPHLIEEEAVEEEFVRRMGMLDPPLENSGNSARMQSLTLKDIDVEMREETIAKSPEPITDSIAAEGGDSAEKDKSPSPKEPVAKKRRTDGRVTLIGTTDPPEVVKAVLSNDRIAGDRLKFITQGWTMLVSEDRYGHLMPNKCLGTMGLRLDAAVELDYVEGACDRCWNDNRALICAIKPEERVCFRCKNGKFGCVWSSQSRDARFTEQVRQTRSRTKAAKQDKKDQAALPIPTIKIPPMRPASGLDASAVRKLPPLPFVLIETTSQTIKDTPRPSREVKNLPQRADDSPVSSQVSTRSAAKKAKKDKKKDKGKARATAQSVSDSLLDTASSVITSPLDSGLPSLFTPPSSNTPLFLPSPLEGSLSLPSASQITSRRLLISWILLRGPDTRRWCIDASCCKPTSR